MPFVLDASIVAYWALDDEDDRVADLTFERIRTDEARVPVLWWFEVRNILIVNEHRSRLTKTATAAFLRELAQMRVLVDRSPDETDILSLASRHRLSVYGASYLELARRGGISLATLDNELRAGALAAGVALLGENDG
ncbi:MAG TPA: type II toxin-antitoxin system VapC family toxin [Acetobacteraceae bacterium]|jgi:predicted nucleic acid-binding protein|nr:type II toxin-antitoxin system VapC family toxin [Acetobacteraceae bacterium]